MPRPTKPVKRICYADGITVWVSGVKIPQLEHKINGYLTEMPCFLRDNSLMMSAPKSTVTLFIPYQMQANTHPKIKISDAHASPCTHTKLLAVYLNTFFFWKRAYTNKGTSYRPMSLLSVNAKTLEKSLSSFHNSTHTKHTHATRVRTQYYIVTALFKQHTFK